MAETKSLFTRFTEWAAHATGKPVAALLAFLTVIIWAATGPVFHYSDTWQLVINTGTTVVTFLMVFLIQSSQNRDTAALQIKLDELIRSIDKADNSLINLEQLEEADLERLRTQYTGLAEAAGQASKQRRGRKAADQLAAES
jgi:low affinity Fe/Cu permease